MFGIFIVKKGYQAGAIEAAYRTNVLLKTWDEFIDLISKQWVIRQLLKIKRTASPLAVFLDPLDVPIDELSDIELKKYRSLVAVCVKQFSTIRTLELSSLEKDFIVFDGHQFIALDELFYYTEDYFKKTISEFNILFKHTHFDRDRLSSWEHMLIPINFDDNKSLLKEVFNGLF